MASFADIPMHVLAPYMTDDTDTWARGCMLSKSTKVMLGEHRSDVFASMASKVHEKLWTIYSPPSYFQKEVYQYFRISNVMDILDAKAHSSLITDRVFERKAPHRAIFAVLENLHSTLIMYATARGITSEMQMDYVYCMYVVQYVMQDYALFVLTKRRYSELAVDPRFRRSMFVWYSSYQGAWKTLDDKELYQKLVSVGKALRQVILTINEQHAEDGVNFTNMWGTYV